MLHRLLRLLLLNDGVLWRVVPALSQVEGSKTARPNPSGFVHHLQDDAPATPRPALRCLCRRDPSPVPLSKGEEVSRV